MRLVKNSILVFGSDITQNLLLVVRNMLLARLLSVEQFGIAATFTILLTLVDAAQNAGIGRMIVQARDADDLKFQNTLHAVSLALGVATALIIALASYPYAVAMGTPDLAWAYLVIAMMPLIRGLGHFDPQRMQRQHRFGPAVARQLVPQFASTIAIWPLYLWLHDFRVILGSIVIAQVLAVSMSHMGAERRFGLAWEPSVVKRAVHFGTPLMLNGLLLFLVLNGDRMIVTNQFGHVVLGGFSAAFMLTLMPTMLVSNSMQSLLLPRMAHAQDDPPRLQRLYDATISALMLIMAAFVAGTALLGPFVMTLLFGHKYEPATPYLLPLAIMQALRVTRVAPALAAMAKAETRNPLYSNIVRVMALPMALLVAMLTGNIFWMIVSGICGEVISALFSAWLARQRIGLHSRHFLFTLLAILLLMGSIALASANYVPYWTIAPAILFFLFTIRDLLTNYKALLRT